MRNFTKIFFVLLWMVSGTAFSQTPNIRQSAVSGTISKCNTYSSTPDLFYVGGDNLTSNLVITAPANVMISTDGGRTYLSKISITPPATTFDASITYYVTALAPPGAFNSDITITSAGATSKTFTISGVIEETPDLTIGTVPSISSSSKSLTVPYTPLNNITGLSYTIASGSFPSNIYSGSFSTSPIVTGTIYPIPAGTYDAYVYTRGTGTLKCLSNFKHFSLVVTQDPSNADLSSLSCFSSGAPFPFTTSFTPSQINYTANVPNNISSIKFTPNAADAGSTIKVNNVLVTSGTTSGSININPGNNLIPVHVTNYNGTVTKDYSVNIIRALNPDNYLTSLSLSTGNLNTPFTSGTFGYNSIVASSITQEIISATTSDPLATFTVNGKSPTTPVILNDGDNIISIVVTAQDATTRQYRILVHRTSSNNNLATLSLSSGTLTPAFSPSITNYTTTLSNGYNLINLYATADPTASVKVSGKSVPLTLPLNVGDNQETVTVTSEEGTVKNYLLTITRAKSSNANLSGLSISTGNFNVGFTSSNLYYTVSLPSTVSSITVTPTVADATASVTVNSVTSTSPVALHMGANTINVKVVAQDGITTKTYVITANVAAPLSSNTNLSGLTVTNGTVIEAFPNNASQFDAYVPVGTTSVVVTPILEDPKATVLLDGSSAGNPITLTSGTTTVNIIVTAEDGSTKKYRLVITLSSTPILGSFSPISAGPDKLINITGINLLGTTNVSFGGTAAKSFTVVSDNLIIAKVGLGTSGYIIVNSTHGSTGIGGFIFDLTLPITFVSLKSKQLSDAVELQWQVADGSDTKQYEVERSLDGINFSTIATVKSNSTTTYTWKDVNALKNNSYYRIKAISLSSGSSIYSTIVKNAGVSNVVSLSVYPNPVVGKSCNVMIMGVSGTSTISLTNHNGQMVLNKVVVLKDDKNTITLQLPKAISAGIYNLSLANNGKIIKSTQVVILNK